MAEEQAPNFQIHKIYVKDISFEVPQGSHAFRNEWKPELNVQLNSQFTKMEEADHYEVVLVVTCDVKCGDEIAFKAEIHQAGIFSISNLDQTQLDHALKSFCPNILYPYAREVISDVVMKGGFPQLCLSPVNFDMLYQQESQQGETTVN
ncbi:protein-export chaperone SecB [Thiotrichales bacterium 19X7-9]|nr:protein-export chaperone SecB [Thiotrichales bacterium 19X7-9]TNF66336.1 MAG: protein-export chaperone SecB [Gammaproteobacteria bacterium]UTW42323.1 protein-export chaperone SecB [bacterium SCSIO 12844]